MSDAVQLFKALGDETRLRILNMLCRRDLCVCQIVDVLGIGQSKASRHLSYLKHAGLVTDRREGLWMYYSLSKPNAELPRQVIECLKRAEDELPMGATDLEALGNLGECGDLCPDHGPSKDGDLCEATEAVVS